MDDSEDREEISRRAGEELVNEAAADNEEDESEAPPPEAIKYFNNKAVSSTTSMLGIDIVVSSHSASLFRLLQRVCPPRRQHTRKNEESIFSVWDLLLLLANWTVLATQHLPLHRGTHTVYVLFCYLVSTPTFTCLTVVAADAAVVLLPMLSQAAGWAQVADNPCSDDAPTPPALMPPPIPLYSTASLLDPRTLNPSAVTILSPQPSPRRSLQLPLTRQICTRMYTRMHMKMFIYIHV